VDFNLWLVNTKAVRTSVQSVRSALDENLPSNAQWTGPPGSQATSKTTIAPKVEVIYRMTGSAANNYLNVRLTAKTKPPMVDTLGSFTFDVYYNSNQLYYSHMLSYQGLLDAGFAVEVYDSTNKHGPFVRVQVYRPDSTYVIGSQNKLLRLRFLENNGPITSHDVAFNLATLSITALKDGAFEDFEEIVPIYDDIYSY